MEGTGVRAAHAEYQFHPSHLSGSRSWGSTFKFSDKNIEADIMVLL